MLKTLLYDPNISGFKQRICLHSKKNNLNEFVLLLISDNSVSFWLTST